MHENAAPPQQYPEYYLCVPGLGPPSLVATALPTRKADQGVQLKTFVADSEEPENVTRLDSVALANGTPPMRVFSPSLFAATVCQAPLLLPIP
jgi:hypothetical protein